MLLTVTDWAVEILLGGQKKTWQWTNLNVCDVLTHWASQWLGQLCPSLVHFVKAGMKEVNYRWQFRLPTFLAVEGDCGDICAARVLQQRASSVRTYQRRALETSRDWCCWDKSHCEISKLLLGPVVLQWSKYHAFFFFQISLQVSTKLHQGSYTSSDRHISTSPRDANYPPDQPGVLLRAGSARTVAAFTRAKEGETKDYRTRGTSSTRPRVLQETESGTRRVWLEYHFLHELHKSSIMVDALLVLLYREVVPPFSSCCLSLC